MKKLLVIWMVGWTLGLGQEKTKIAVMDLKAQQGVSQQVTASLTNLLCTAVSDIGSYEVLGRDDMKTMLEHVAEQQLLGCDDTKCLIQIGGALGVSLIISGDIGQIGQTYLVNLKLIDIDNAIVLKRISEPYKGSEDGLIGKIGECVDLMFDVSKESSAETLNVSEIETKPAAILEGKQDIVPEAKPEIEPEATPLVESGQNINVENGHADNPTLKKNMNLIGLGGLVGKIYLGGPEVRINITNDLQVGMYGSYQKLDSDGNIHVTYKILEMTVRYYLNRVHFDVGVEYLSGEMQDSDVDGVYSDYSILSPILVGYEFGGKSKGYFDCGVGYSVSLTGQKDLIAHTNLTHTVGKNGPRIYFSVGYYIL